MNAIRQIALPFPETGLYPPSEFLESDSNEAALAFLANIAEWPGGRLCVWGEQGCGKSHFAHVFAARTGGMVLPASELTRDKAALTAPAIAIDDADTATDARALLHLLNLAQEEQRPVLLLARTPPAAWDFSLPDLVSRLRAMLAVQIKAPDDELLAALLRLLAAQRQILIDEAVRDWLLTQLPREGGALRTAILRLDRASLAARLPITMSFARKILADLLPDLLQGNDDFIIPPSQALPFLL